jgi:hypothetical protein
MIRAPNGCEQTFTCFAGMIWLALVQLASLAIVMFCCAWLIRPIELFTALFAAFSAT